MAIERLAPEGDPARILFPRPFLDREGFDFSFSGLKTAVLRHLQTHPAPSAGQIAHIAAGFQEAVVDVLVHKALAAARAKECRHLALVGGVAANGRLRERLRTAAAARRITVYIPPVSLCGDNAAMVAAAGYHHLAAGRAAGLDEDVFSRNGF